MLQIYRYRKVVLFSTGSQNIIAIPITALQLFSPASSRQYWVAWRDPNHPAGDDNFRTFLLLMMIRDTWSACGMRQDNSRFFRSPFLVRCHFENAGKRIFGGLLTLVLNNGMIWSENKSSQTCSYYLLSYPLYLWSNCGIAKSRNDWE